MKKFTLLLILQFVSIVAFSQSKKDSVYVKNAIFEMVYSETLEQPKWVKYTVQCAENTVSRKGLDFYTEKTIHTSNGDDWIAILPNQDKLGTFSKMNQFGTLIL